LFPLILKIAFCTLIIFKYLFANLRK